MNPSITWVRVSTQVVSDFGWLWGGVGGRGGRVYSIVLLYRQRASQSVRQVDKQSSPPRLTTPPPSFPPPLQQLISQPGTSS